ncbi:MAG: FAD-dependent oxidoreductase [Myxococcales bacterium]|nr:FAD-dependent oxidoreductase [Myxococcales bacterium]USN50401.1 MAG: FAD-dependent oxidoreductase [Myxococcales bacterium]
MTKNKTIIVVGGSHGGPNAVARARQADENAKIILIEQAPHIMWAQTSVRSQLLCEDKMAALLARDSYFQQRYNVEVMTRTCAVELDLDSRCLVVEHEKTYKRLHFDSLIYAGGAQSNRLVVPGFDGERICHFRDFRDISLIKEAIKEGAKTATVVGCGFYGVEAALTLKELGFNVRIIEQRKRIMQSFSLAFSQSIVDHLKQAGIEILLGAQIKDAETQADNSLKLRLESNEIIESDLVVVCIGLTPRTSLLVNAGAALDPDGLIRVDDSMATTLPNVYACGSSVSVPMVVTHQRKWVPHPAIVLRTAHIAGFNAAINDPALIDHLKPFCGTLYTKIHETSFARTGLSEQEARSFFREDNTFVTTVFGSAEDSFLCQQEMCVRLLVDKNKGCIIGGEVYGQKGVDRTIDLISVAVSEAWAPEKLVDLDMAFLLDSGPVFDPLKVAATRAKMALIEGETSISAEQLALWVASKVDFRLVDVGETAMFTGYTQKKIQHLPLESLREHLNELSKEDTPIVLYSRSGYRSYLAQRLLKQRGIKNVFHLDGGLATWNLVLKE